MTSSTAESGPPTILGGTVPGDARLLDVVNVKKLLQSRCLEIEELFDALRRGDKQEMVFQRLPFVLRRRAMSHNPFRVPKRLRIPLAREMARSVPKCAKRLRKDHRKRLNRLEEYRTRCARNQWLETHLYHAKRFKMESLWGYRIAVRTMQKCKRRCLRYCKRLSVVHDLSYVKVVNVSGRLSELRQAFANIFSDHSLMFTEQLLSGAYRSKTFAYLTSGDTHRLICPVHFIWIPAEEQRGPPSKHVRQIWVFVHPAAIDEFCEALREGKPAIDFSVHKDICIFEVMGPLAALLLRTTLKMDDSSSKNNSLWRHMHPQNIDIPPSYILPLRVVDPKLYGNHRPAFKLESMRSQAFPQEDLVLEEVDPEERRLLTTFKTPEDTNIITKVNVPRMRKRNWGNVVAKLLKKLNVKYPNSGIDDSKNGSKGPGNASETTGDIDMNVTADVNKGNKKVGNAPKVGATTDCSKQSEDIDMVGNDYVPIWVIRRGDALGGFDLVIPTGTMARKLWILLNRYGALGIGLEEREMLYAQNNQCMFPQDYPETLAGRRHFHAIEVEQICKYLGTPGNKRPNYQLMGVERPFGIPMCCMVSMEMKKHTTHRNSPKNSHNGFLTTLPDEWMPKEFKRRSYTGYMQSRHLLLGCVTAGIHKSDIMKCPEFQVLRLSRSLNSTSGLYLIQLLHRLATSTKRIEVASDKLLMMSCWVEIVGHGSVAPYSRLYMPSASDLKDNHRFLSFVMQQPYNCGLKRVGSTGAKMYGRSSSSAMVPSKLERAAVPKSFEEPIHAEYKLNNLKGLFGCTKKCRMVAPAAAADGMLTLEKNHRPPVRGCFGIVTSTGFSHRGNCIVHLQGFLDLLRSSTATFKAIAGKQHQYVPVDRIRLFTWVRNNHSREYNAGILSITLEDSITASI
ncbi:ribonucleases P/MRP protein subunit Pop1 [Babesia gibsoni]|uniref:Ribonucleases P/MRP protein subunit Pop1 n=1 Tax=Babesia gibsoni TaxID=33632 RepID=A0AAD8PF86_BABGI|nr:ribonucleases P/MRP protein subunit Pop1 [Babesia gibsoni]